MRSKFFLIPAALIAAAPAAIGPAVAGAYYLTIEQAQNLLFPGATFTEDFITLTDKQMKDIESDSGVALPERQIRLWKVSNGSWFMLDQVVGLDSTVTYAVGLDPKGTVTGIEVLECWEHYDQVRLPEWRAQFKGKRRGTMKDDGGIEKISGTTLSSVHITEGVTRILSTFVYAIAPQ